MADPILALKGTSSTWKLTNVKIRLCYTVRYLDLFDLADSNCHTRQIFGLSESILLLTRRQHAGRLFRRSGPLLLVIDQHSGKCRVSFR